MLVAKSESLERPNGGNAISTKVEVGYIHTYWHLGRNAARMMAAEAMRPLPLKSASVILVFIVTASSSPKVIAVNAPLAAISGASMIAPST